MGFLDFLKRNHLQKNEGPSLHYAFAHFVLRQIALSNPLVLLAIATSPEADTLLNGLLLDASKHFGMPLAFGAEDVTLHKKRIGNFPCVIFELPEPQRIAEAFMTAVVIEVDTTVEAPPEPGNVKARYFTLEKGGTFGNESRTVLAEWTQSQHSSYGYGPDPLVEEFVRAIESLV